MPFDAGSITFRRFAVIGRQAEALDEGLLEKFAAAALRPGELGAPEEIEYGWCGGRHVLDDLFNFERNVFADALHVALRIDTNKPPSELKKAYRAIEEDAAAKENPSGFISKRQKKIAKETSDHRLDQELRSGKFRRSRLTPLLWDVPGALVFCGASSKSQDMLLELFERTTGLNLQPLSAGSLALRILEGQGRRRDYEDAMPTRFVIGPEGASQSAAYPWVAKGPEAKDFLGNEFLVWLWYQTFIHEGAVRTDVGELTIFFDRMLDLDCAFGQTGRDSLRNTGVTRMPEAIDGLRTGKVPRKIGFVLEQAGDQCLFTLSAETLAVSALKLPEIKEAENPRVLFEERIALLRDFSKTIDALFTAFLKTRTSSAWEGQVDAIRKWITQLGRVTASAVA